MPVSVRRWRGIAPDIDQVALDQHFVSIHLGGAKRLLRRGEGRRAMRDVGSGAFSVVPAGAAFYWETVGPIDFAHFYFEPKLVDHVVASAFDRDPSYAQLQETLGDADPLIGSLTLSLIEELEADDPQQAYL